MCCLLNKTCVGTQLLFLGVSVLLDTGYGAGAARGQGGQPQGEGFRSFKHLENRRTNDKLSCAL